MKDSFSLDDISEFIIRIDKLTPTTKPIWGKMSVEKMLAHCNVTYELEYDTIHPKPKGFKKWMLTIFIKNRVVSQEPYKRNGKTGSEFVIRDSRIFDNEKERLVNYIKKTQQLGENHFDGKESHSFGILTKSEWNTMFSKHLDHHLTQFGV
jgi:hypothetical protein